MFWRWMRLSKDSKSEIKLLMRDTGRTKPEEVVNDALTAYEWLVRQNLFGYIAAAANDDCNVVARLVMEPLEYARGMGSHSWRDEDTDTST
jgi:hypothetical protein